MHLPRGSIQKFEEYGHAQTMRHCVKENPGRFGLVSFRPGRFSLGLLHASQQCQHLRLLSDIVLQKVTPDRMLHQYAEVWFVSANNWVGSFRPWHVFSRQGRFRQSIGTCKADGRSVEVI